MSATNTEEEQSNSVRSFHDFRTSGFLWLVNTTVFHPRGFAIGFAYSEDGEVIGWQLLGDGSERWTFAEGCWPKGESPDDAFEATQREFCRQIIKQSFKEGTSQ